MKQPEFALLSQILKLSNNHRKLLHYFFRCSKTMKKIFFAIPTLCKKLEMQKTCVRDFLRENPNLISRQFRNGESSIFRIFKDVSDAITFLEKEGIWHMNRRQRMQWLHVQKANPLCPKSEPYSYSYSGKNRSPAEAKQASSPIVDPAITLLNLPRSAQQILVKIGMNAFDMTNAAIKAKIERNEPIYDLESYANHIFSKRLRRMSDRVIKSLQ